MATLGEVYEKSFPSRRPSPWELRSWLFMRISGILMLGLLLGHVAIMHVFGGGVERISFEFVAARWSGFFWRTYDWLLLVLALLHGAIGARIVIEDYIRRDGLRVLARSVLYTTTFVFLALGTIVTVTFNAPGGG